MSFARKIALDSCFLAKRISNTFSRKNRIAMLGAGDPRLIDQETCRVEDFSLPAGAESTEGTARRPVRFAILSLHGNNEPRAWDQ